MNPIPKKEFLILRLSVSQGYVDFLSEIAVFESYEAAKKHLDENRDKYKSVGNPWSGLTEYRIALCFENRYLDPLTEKPLEDILGYGSFPQISKIQRN